MLTDIAAPTKVEEKCEKWEELWAKFYTEIRNERETEFFAQVICCAA